MKVYIARYGWCDNHTFQDYWYVVIASDEDRALGLVMGELPETKRDSWSFEELPMDQAAAWFVTQRGS